MVEYTRAQQAQAADELDDLPMGTMIERMLTDYAGLRAQVRACK